MYHKNKSPLHPSESSIISLKVGQIIEWWRAAATSPEEVNYLVHDVRKSLVFRIKGFDNQVF